MASSTNSFDAFAAVDKIVSKPVLGSDGAASWQEFRKETKELQRESVAPALQVKRADRLGTGMTSLSEERSNENKIRSEAGDSTLGSGYTVFKRKINTEEASERKRRKRIEKRIRPEKKQYFIPSESFSGWKFDYVFTTRDKKTGFYWDGTDSVKNLKGVDFPTTTNEPGDEAEHGTQEKKEGKAASKIKKSKLNHNGGANIAAYDPDNPLDQVADAIRRRNEALKAPPASTYALRSGWESATDSATGKAYYFNRATGERSWTLPTIGALPAGWKDAKDASGKTYYYHSNGETRWERPM